jgi:hypothetical protein
MLGNRAQNFSVKLDYDNEPSQIVKDQGNKILAYNKWVSYQATNSIGSNEQQIQILYAES